MYSYVYVILLKDQSKFKIGKANNIKNRLGCLKLFWGDFDLDKSFAIKCKKSKVMKLETFLHFTFSKYRLNDLSRKDGFTEFFNVNCFDLVKPFVESLININSDLSIIQIKELKKDFNNTGTCDFNKRLLITVEMESILINEILDNLKNAVRSEEDKNLMILTLNLNHVQKLLDFSNDYMIKFCNKFNPKFPYSFIENISYNYSKNELQVIYSEYNHLLYFTTSFQEKRLLEHREKLIGFYLDKDNIYLFEENIMFQRLVNLVRICANQSFLYNEKYFKFRTSDLEQLLGFKDSNSLKIFLDIYQLTFYSVSKNCSFTSFSNPFETEFYFDFEVCDSIIFNYDFHKLTFLEFYFIDIIKEIRMDIFETKKKTILLNNKRISNKNQKKIK